MAGMFDSTTSSVFSMDQHSSEIHKSARMTSDFDDVKLIGKGGFGKVFSGTHKIDKRTCAIKCIPLEEGKEDWAFREVSVLVKLQHNNVLNYIHAWLESHSIEENRYQDEDYSGNSDGSFEHLTNTLDKLDLNKRPKTTAEPSSSSTENSDSFVFCRSDNIEVASHSTSTNADSTTTDSKDSNDEPQGTTNKKLQIREYLYMVTELCHKHTLYHRLLDKHRPSYQIDRLGGLKIFYQIVNGMTYIHERPEKLIHRDLKPANIFFSITNSTVKIGDFGLAKGITVVNDDSEENENENDDDQNHRRNDEYITTRASRGTPSYHSPEQTRREQPTQKVDIYAMGLILLELLYPMSTQFERKKVFDGVKEATIKLPDDFERILQNKTRYESLLRRLLAHNKDDRPTARELHENIRNDIDPDDYRSLYLDATAVTQLDVRQNRSHIHLMMEKTLCKPFSYQIVRSTIEIQYGVFDVCDPYDVILLCDNNHLILINHRQQLGQIRWQNDRTVGFVICIHWCPYLDQYLILSYYRLYRLPVVRDAVTSRITLGKLSHQNTISVHLARSSSTADPLTVTASNIRARLRFVTSSPKRDGYLYINRDYCFIDKWNMISWQLLQTWSKRDLGYEQRDEMRAITCSIDGSYLAINVQIAQRAWIVDFRKTDVDMTLLKRISMPNALSIYHKAEIPFESQLWLMIQTPNKFMIVSANPQDSSIEEIETRNVQPSGDVCLHLRFFERNRYLMIGTIFRTDNGDRGALQSYLISSE